MGVNEPHLSWLPASASAELPCSCMQGHETWHPFSVPLLCLACCVLLCFVLFLLCGLYLPVNWPWKTNWIQNMANFLCSYVDTTALHLSILSSLPMKCGAKIKVLDLIKSYMEITYFNKDLLFLLKTFKGRKHQVWHPLWINVVLLAQSRMYLILERYVCAYICISTHIETILWLRKHVTMSSRKAAKVILLIKQKIALVI